MLLIGATRAGKSQIANVAAGEPYNNGIIATVGLDLQMLDFKMRDSYNRLILWDTVIIVL